ncbi:iron chelate uptake ABC transporter family permease subunit [Nesterenkonia sandarakina]|uniref:Iron complex transport system permease protein n=1 Tax=Nesterenkonia sandarakina TaxID=272918 RepID=A0A7Z0J236_9MICC|nr:iron chelate uptake ABC transporter family permease subunit [Nesterenkonia sandarakina]NYJ15860.1 iron complex transport system permease protein [Nesterenkonia sandarakina]
MTEQLDRARRTGQSAAGGPADSGTTAPGGGAPGDEAPDRETPAQLSRHSGAITTGRHRVRYWGVMALLGGLSVFFTAGILGYDNPMPFGTEGYWLIARMRAETVLVIGVVVLAQAMATVAFQTATNNRIITPSIMGFESLYVAIQTGAVFFFGIAGVTLVTGLPQFLMQAAAMVLFAVILYSWLLSGRFSNIHIMLLVGVVLGGGLGSLATFMQRVLTPSEFDVLTARLFGNIGNARSEYLPYALPIVLAAALLLWWRARRLNVVALGRNTAENLGVDHRREVMLILTLVSVLMAMSTSLVGPMTFLGFLVATLAYQFADTYSHRMLFPMAILIGYTVLAGAYFIMRNIFYAQGAVTLIIELLGGVVFLIVLMRKGRL